MCVGGICNGKQTEQKLNFLFNVLMLKLCPYNCVATYCKKDVHAVYEMFWYAQFFLPSRFLQWVFLSDCAISR